MPTRISLLCGLALSCLAAVLAGGGAVARADQSQDVLADVDRLTVELKDVETQMEHLYRRVPTCEDTEEELWLREWATQAGELKELRLAQVGEGERLRLADGRPSSIVMRRMEISGRDPYAKVDLFLRRLSLRSGLIGLESLRVEAAAEGTVQYTARLALPCHQRMEEAATQDRPSMDAFLRDRLSWLQGERHLLLDLTARSQPGALVTALAAVEEGSRGQAVALTRLRSGEEVVLEGVVRGAASRDGLHLSLERAGFLVAEIQMEPAGVCERFSVKARLDAPAEAGEETPISIRNGLFEAQPAPYCEPLPGMGRIAVRGAAPDAPGALTLHLRDIDVIDLFSVLHDLSPESFVIDPRLVGQISVDVEGATIEETLAALGTVDVAVGPGTLRQVTRAGSPPARARSAAAFTGEAIDVEIRGAELGEFVCVIEMISQRPVRVSRAMQGPVRVFSRELPWDQVLDGVAALAGMVMALDEKGVFIGPATEAQGGGGAEALEACDFPASEPESRLAPSREWNPMAGIGDLELVGLGRAGETWRAYAYTPTRGLLILAPGTKLMDGEVRFLDSLGVTFATPSGQDIRVLFQP